MSQSFRTYVLEQLGRVRPDIRDRSIFEIKGFEIFEDGWMRHKHDLDGLKRYLVHLGLMKSDQEISMGIT